MDFQAQIIEHAPFDVAVAAMRAIRCPKCGGGPDKICFGMRPRSISADRQVRKEPPDAPLKDRVADWRDNGDIGISSEVMMRHLRGVRLLDKSHPLDLSDFRSCVLLLDRLPEFSAMSELARLSDLSPQWAAIVQNWDALMTLWRSESGPDLDPEWLAPKTRLKLSQILDAAA